MWFKVSNRKQPSELPDIVVDDTALQVVTKQKYLGVLIILSQFVTGRE